MHAKPPRHRGRASVATVGIVTNAYLPCHLKRAARRLRIELRVLGVPDREVPDRDSFGLGPSRKPSGPWTGLLINAATCDVVTVDPEVVTTDVDVFERIGIDVRPSQQSVRFTIDSDHARHVLQRCGSTWLRQNLAVAALLFASLWSDAPPDFPR